MEVRRKAANKVHGHVEMYLSEIILNVYHRITLHIYFCLVISTVEDLRKGK